MGCNPPNLQHTLRANRTSCWGNQKSCVVQDRFRVWQTERRAASNTWHNATHNHVISWREKKKANRNSLKDLLSQPATSLAYQFSTGNRLVSAAASERNSLLLQNQDITKHHTLYIEVVSCVVKCLTSFLMHRPPALGVTSFGFTQWQMSHILRVFTRDHVFVFVIVCPQVRVIGFICTTWENCVPYLFFSHFQTVIQS